ncbi:hypothetical protein EW146_g3471 [Bondarzewia mesenterica]|uniref:Uncharacterized protein n=1 Tax=Bondarzewia mesenterica TaxID=1095465 RepID=A0A4S4LYW6_9AGAM|nr:hypothetical protein EW146_g3471 [Bondarzewia mesenterica]
MNRALTRQIDASGGGRSAPLQFLYCRINDPDPHTNPQPSGKQDIRTKAKLSNTKPKQHHGTTPESAEDGDEEWRDDIKGGKHSDREIDNSLHRERSSRVVRDSEKCYQDMMAYSVRGSGMGRG